MQPGPRAVAHSIVLCGALAAGAAAENDARPFDGTLPTPESDVSVNREPEDADRGTRVATLVLDGATGLPVPGATLAWLPERSGSRTLSYAEPLDRGRADDRGICVVDVGAWEGGDAHWVADAPGYAPVHDYGPRPPSRMLLHRGVDRRGRVLDARGQPVAGAVVEIFAGCSHSLRVREAVTGTDGAFVLRSADPADLHGCVRTGSGLCRFTERFGGLGRRPVDVVLRASIRVRGRILDDAKEPMEGVVVRSSEFQRWPVAVTGADGGFELESFERGDSLSYAFERDDDVVGSVTDRIYGDDPRITFRVDPESGAPIPPEGDGAIEVRVRQADGSPVPAMNLLLVRRGDGVSERLESADDGAPAAIDEIPSGVWDVSPATPFEPAAFTTQRTDVLPLDRTRIDIVASPQPVLRVTGALPVPAAVTLVAAGHELDWDDDVPLSAWTPHVPRTGDVWLRVEPERQPLAFFVPLGATTDGVRTADLVLPAPHRITVSGVPGVGSMELRCDGADVAWCKDGATIATYARGPMALDVEARGATRRFVFDLGDEPSQVDLAWEAGLAAEPPGRVRVTAHDPEGVSMSVLGRSFRVHGVAEADAHAPCRVVVRKAGHQPLDRWFAGPGTVVHRWGTSSLRLVLRDGSGAPAEAVVGVDGVFHWTRDGVLELAGLTPGPHAVLVDPLAPHLVGAEMRIDLPGEGAIERIVDLAAR